MKTNVIAKIEIEGLHNWPAADQIFPEVGFLSHMHRHEYYNPNSRTHEFGAKSCEMLAKEIMEEFGCCYVSVFEDNENGAEIYE